jgi:hypothetical protein
MAIAVGASQLRHISEISEVCEILKTLVKLQSNLEELCKLN